MSDDGIDRLVALLLRGFVLLFIQFVRLLLKQFFLRFSSFSRILDNGLPRLIRNGPFLGEIKLLCVNPTSDNSFTFIFLFSPK